MAINYDDNTQLLAGLPNTISQHKIARGKRSKADVPNSKVRLVIVLNNNSSQIPTLYDVKLTENWQEEEKIPIKSATPKPAAKPEAKNEEGDKKDGDEKQDGAAAAAPPDDQKPPEEVEEQKYETKIRNRERTTQINFTTVSHAIPPDVKKDLRKVEDQIWAADRELLDIKEAKYLLESYMYEMKNGVQEYGNYEHYIDASIRDQYLATLQET